MPSRAPAPSSARPDQADLSEQLVVTCASFSRAAARLSVTDSPTAVWRTLAILDEHGALRTGDLAVLDRCSQPTATAMVQRLEADGTVQRTPDPSDRRASLVSLSAAGRERLALLRAEVAAALAPRLARLSEQQTAELGRALSTIAQLAADRSDPDPRPEPGTPVRTPAPAGRNAS